MALSFFVFGAPSTAGVSAMVKMLDHVFEPPHRSGIVAGLMKVAHMRNSSDFGSVLLVEDDCLLAMDLCDQVQETGARVIGPAPSLTTAMALLDHPPWPDFAMLDIELCDGPVYPLAERLLELGTPFVFVSGMIPDAIPPRFAEVPLFSKPLHLPQLTNSIWSYSAPPPFRSVNPNS